MIAELIEKDRFMTLCVCSCDCFVVGRICLSECDLSADHNFDIVNRYRFLGFHIYIYTFYSIHSFYI